MPGAALAVALVGTGLALTLAALPFDALGAPVAGIALFAFGGAVVIAQVGRWHPHARFGVANGITVLRGGGAALFAALALDPPVAAGTGGWPAFAVAVALFALDGVDGLMARRQRLASAFGARFDLDVDAALMLALAVLAVGLGKAGPWILAIGLMRYVFVAAGRVEPALARPLPPSRRRSAVCALQVGTLTLLLAPPVTPPFSEAIAALSLAALAASFWADVRWLRRPPLQ